VIGVIAKAPQPGRVKTRLCPPLTPLQAAAVASALLADTVATALSTGHEVVIVGAGPRALLRAASGTEAPILAQRGHGLDQRLEAASADLFAAGADRVVLLGADCPTVSPVDLTGAVSALDDADVALGPACDGGYTMLGAAAHHPQLYLGVPMSTSSTAAVTLERAAAAGLPVAVLAARSDVDTVEDLLAADAAGQLRGAPRTRALLEELLTGPVGRRFPVRRGASA
jgi:rSAM/selenodomain-associated transferase 1